MLPQRRKGRRKQLHDLSSGIDLALRVVDRYFGRDVAQATATIASTATTSLCLKMEGN
ncbi:MAG TPA: hypothetical protein VKB02_03090 [Pyrinomonadaceae bacterium]|nr:hypothetical protein [Pyrinomonadaceae bacterium]